MRPRKKDLTFVAFALILAPGAFGKSSSNYYWRPRASAKSTFDANVLLAPFYVQNRSLSSLFCGVAQNFFNLNKSLRQCKSDVQNRPSPAPFYPQSLRVSSIICRYAQNKFNSRRSCHGVANMRKFKTIAQNKT